MIEPKIADQRFSTIKVTLNQFIESQDASSNIEPLIIKVNKPRDNMINPQDKNFSIGLIVELRIDKIRATTAKTTHPLPPIRMPGISKSAM